MVMEKGLDSGPILLQREIAIGDRETTAELSPRLAEAGAALMIETVHRIAARQIEPRPQRASLVTQAPRLERADGRVDWRRDARTQFNRLRGFTPWPGLHAEQGGRPVKLLAAEPVRDADAVAPGVVGGLRRGLLEVGCGGGTTLGISSLQRPGGRPLAAVDFVNGERLGPGDHFD
jgi:methionyl-tRNA formyltransferase